jgi:hypothetical protein
LYVDVGRSKYELKKQIYLDALDTFSEIMKYWDRKDKGLASTDDFYDNSFKFQSIIYKFQLRGCSKEIYDIADKKLTEPVFTIPKKAHDIIQKELIPAFEKDLTNTWSLLK